MAGASLQELLALVDSSFLHRTSQERFEMHDLVRQYAAEKLALSCDEEVKTRDRHSVYYAAVLQKWAIDLRGCWRSTAGAGIGPEIEDAHAAWKWMVARMQVSHMAQAMEGVWVSYRHNARLEEGEAAFQDTAGVLAAEEGRSALPAEGLRMWVRALAYQGYFVWRLGSVKAAEDLFDQSEALLEDPRLAGQDVRATRAFVLCLRGCIEHWSRDRQRAWQPFEQSLALYRALGRRADTARVLMYLGDAALTRGALDEAERILREALAIYRDVGNCGDIVPALTELSTVLRDSGRLVEAEHLAREAVEISQARGDPAMMVDALASLSIGLCHSGKYADSHQVVQVCSTIADDLADHTFRSYAASVAARTYLHLGQYGKAHDHACMLLDIGTEVKGQWDIGEALSLLGAEAAAEGDYAEARRRLQESIDVLERMHHRYKDMVLVILAFVDRAEGCRQLAMQTLRETLGSLVVTPQWDILLTTLPAAALLALDAGDAERAVELYACAAREPRVANSRWFEDIAGREIASASTVLSPETVDAAQERGRGRDLLATARELLEELERHKS